jgi:two-component system, cell cycle response regulator DivK
MNSYPHSLQPSFVRHHLLAVDDNDDSLLLLTQTLTRLDRSLVTAQTGKTALTLAQTLQPDLILLDIVLPDLSGFDVMRQLKQNAITASIPIIAVTALARADDRQKLLQGGCIDCISKPYLLEELELAVERCLSPAALACA